MGTLNGRDESFHEQPRGGEDGRSGGDAAGAARPAGRAETGDPAQPDASLQPGGPPERPRREREKERRRFQEEVASRGARLQRHRERGHRGIWLGLATFGMVGWSIAIPALLGIAIGLWLDNQLGSGRRYTLSFFMAGLAFGMVNVWRWINEYRDEPDDDGEPGDDEGADDGRQGTFSAAKDDGP